MEEEDEFEYIMSSEDNSDEDYLFDIPALIEIDTTDESEAEEEKTENETDKKSSEHTVFFEGMEKVDPHRQCNIMMSDDISIPDLVQCPDWRNDRSSEDEDVKSKSEDDESMPSLIEDRCYCSSSSKDSGDESDDEVIPDLVKRDEKKAVTQETNIATRNKLAQSSFCIILGLDPFYTPAKAQTVILICRNIGKEL